MIFTTKDKVSSKNHILYYVLAFGLFAFGMFAFEMLSVAWFLFWGVSILLAYLGGKLQAFAKSHITLYNDKIEGLVISGSKNVVSINYVDIQSLGISEDQNRVIVRDKYGEFTFQAHECARKVLDLINNQMNLSKSKYCPKCNASFTQAFCPTCGFVPADK